LTYTVAWRINHHLRHKYLVPVVPTAIQTVDAPAELECNARMPPAFDEERIPVDDQSVFIVGIANPQRFERLVAEAKAANAHLSEKELDDIINEAVEWARNANARHS